jgi:glycosyltransferase involved in cell wall biosynthesis
MEKPKVIHVLYSGLGGHSNVVFPLLETDFGKNHINILVFFGVEPMLPAYRDYCKKLGINYFTIEKKPKRYLNAFASFKKLIRAQKPDRILIHSNELIIPSIRYRNKISECDVYYIEHENNATKGFVLNFLSKYALKRADAVICLTENYQKELTDKYHPKVPTVVIPNGINTEKFHPSILKSSEQIILGMASRMIPGKDHPILLKSFKKVIETFPTAHLNIAGIGETLDEIQQLTRSLGLENHVSFLGMLDEENLIKFYKELNLYVLATKSETMSTAILQAMASGLPVISSNIQNNAELIDDGENGWLYTPNDEHHLTEIILNVLSNPENAMRVGKNARIKVVENYSAQSMSARYTALLK